MTDNLYIPCNEQLINHKLGIFNHIHALHIPTGVNAFISFTNTPGDQKKYPLTDVIQDLDNRGNLVAEPRQAYLHTTGTSAEDINIIGSEVNTDGGYIAVKPQDTISLEPSTKAIIEGLDKITNPYQLPTLTTGQSNSTTAVDLINKTLSCDKIIVTLNIGRMAGTILDQDGWIGLNIDGNLVATAGGGGAQVSGAGHVEMELEDVNGKTLQIRGLVESSGSADKIGYTLQEYTLKQ